MKKMQQKAKTKGRFFMEVVFKKYQLLQYKANLILPLTLIQLEID
jgi:hypothetical protein